MLRHLSLLAESIKSSDFTRCFLFSDFSWLFQSLGQLQIQDADSLIGKGRELKLCNKLIDLMHFDELPLLTKYANNQVCRLIQAIMAELVNINTFVAASPQNLHAFIKFIKHLTSLILALGNLDDAGEVKFAFNREVPAEVLAVVKDGPNKQQRVDLYADVFFRIGLNEPQASPSALEVAQTAYQSTVEDDRFDEKVMSNSE